MEYAQPDLACPKCGNDEFYKILFFYKCTRCGKLIDELEVQE